MEIHKTYRFKLRLTKSQQQTIDHYINVSRLVYNLAKETKEYAYRAHGVSLTCYDLQQQLTELRGDIDWISSVPRKILVDTLERLDKSFKRFFVGSGYPRWAYKDRYLSITFKDYVRGVSLNRISLPRIGAVKYFASRPLEGDIKRATIKKELDGYYITVVTKQVVTPALSAPYDSQVGLDMGVAHFCSTSDGKQYANPRFLETQLKRLRVAQRSLSRKKKESNNRAKQKRVVARLHQKIRRQRQDYLHKVSTEITNQYQTVVVEDLNVAGMSRSRLARSINDVGWAGFFDILEYKTVWKGGQLLRVNPAYTSQTCSHCGHVDARSRKSQSEFECVICGHTENADINAAKNINGRGTSEMSANVEALGSSVGHKLLKI